MPDKTEDSLAVTLTLVLVLVIAVAAGAVYVLRGSSSSEEPGGGAAVIGLGSPAPTSGAPASTRTPKAGEGLPGEIGSGTGTTCVPQTRQAELTVVTYNIHSGLGHGRGLQLDTIAQELKSWRADVVLLQEVDRFRGWTGRVDTPSVLAADLGWTWTFGDNVRGADGSQYGTAILSRFPIRSANNVLLPAPPGTQQRGLLHARIDVNGIAMSIYDTHLEHSSPSARLAQIRTIMPILRADPLPKVLGGDFNATPESPVLAVARGGLTDTWTVAGTGPAKSVPKARLDYLLYSPTERTTIVPKQAVVLRSAVSDHDAVWATYRLETRDAAICVPLIPEQTD